MIFGFLFLLLVIVFGIATSVFGMLAVRRDQGDGPLPR